MNIQRIKPFCLAAGLMALAVPALAESYTYSPLRSWAKDFAVPRSGESDTYRWLFVLSKQQRNSILLRAGTLAAALDWERDALSAGRADEEGVEPALRTPQAMARVFRRSGRYLQHEIRQCYDTAAQPSAAEACSEADNILAAHLASDHAYHQQRVGRFDFHYPLHERTRQWNVSHAARVQVLHQEAAEARRLFKAQLSAAPAGAGIHQALAMARQYVRDQLDQWAEAPPAAD